METKICRKCGRELPLSEFHKDKQKKDGYRNVCKECINKRMKQYYNENAEKIKERVRKYSEENKETVLAKKRAYFRTKIGRAYTLKNAYIENDKLQGRITDEIPENYVTAEWIVNNIFTKPCAHCGEIDWTKIGCNRLDNSKPHTVDNVEPCCEECNRNLWFDEKKKKVYQYTLDGHLVKIWDSLSETKKNWRFPRCKHTKVY